MEKMPQATSDKLIDIPPPLPLCLTKRDFDITSRAILLVQYSMNSFNY